MTSAPKVAEGSGVIVLAAYRPDPELFAVQLRSIRDQTRGDFRCLIGADGGQDEVRALVAEVVGDDARFQVIGWDDNLGFYLNFERLLEAIPDDVTWVALSDQDDRWYPDKLERLIPLLDGASLATAQARVVTWPAGTIVADRTERRLVAARDLLVQNQVTGAQSVLRRTLLDVALPFPRLRTVTQLHDHWLAMCAAASGGYAVLDEIVQDYMQHGANLVGEVDKRHPRSPVGAARLVRDLADQYESGHGPRHLLSAPHAAGIGWRRLMACELARRLPRSSTALDLHRRLGAPGVRATSRAVAKALLSRDVTTGTALTLAAGLPAELLASRLGSSAWRLQAGSVPEETSVSDATCWLCDGQASFDNPFSTAGYARCSRCGFLFQPARNSAEAEAAMYDSEYFDSYDQRTGRRVQRLGGRVPSLGHYDLATAQRRSEAGIRAAYVLAHTQPPGTLLEVGAASGYFVTAATDSGFDAVGVEPSGDTAAAARARGASVRSGTLADVAAEGEQFDVVCAWHVLEHLPEPRSAMGQVRSILRPGGWLFLELPNIGSVAARRGGVGWAHLDAGAHVAHYTPAHVVDLLGGAGLEVHGVESLSIRMFSRSRPRRLLHAVYDTVVLQTPARVHPGRHELLRVAARRPVDDA